MKARPGFFFTSLFAMAAFFVAAFVAVWIAWSVVLWVVDRVVDLMPAQWEVELGQQALGEMDNHGVDDPVLRDTVAGIATRLIAKVPEDTPYEISVTPVWKKEANAFALPGGPTLVTSGLLAQAETPDEVAGVLGHELAHVLHRHAFHALARQQGVSMLIALCVGDNSTIGAIARGGNALMNLGFSRANELDADRTGMKLAWEAGFRPMAMGDFFRRQQRLNQLSPGAERALAFLSTHPANGDRLVQLDRYARKLPARAHNDFAPPADWATIQAHAAAIPGEVVSHDAGGRRR